MKNLSRKKVIDIFNKNVSNLIHPTRTINRKKLSFEDKLLLIAQVAQHRGSIYCYGQIWYDRNIFLTLNVTCPTMSASGRFLIKKSNPHNVFDNCLIITSDLATLKKLFQVNITKEQVDTACVFAKLTRRENTPDSHAQVVIPGITNKFLRRVP